MSEQALTPKTAMMAQTLSLGGTTDILGWLVERFGPALSELLLELLMKKSQPGAALSAGDLFGSFDLKNLAVVAIERFGPALVDELVGALNSRQDLPSKIVASILDQHKAELIAMLVGWLQTPGGAKVIDDAVAKILSVN